MNSPSLRLAGLAGLLCAFVVAVPSGHGQSARPLDVVASLDALLLRQPKPGESLMVASGLSSNYWGTARLVTHNPTNNTQLATNRGNVFNTSLGVGGQWVFNDRTNLVQDTRWWNSRGDGTTDDTVALQAAFDSGASSIFLPRGTSIVSAPLVISTRGQRIYGDGTIKEASILTNILRVAANNVQLKDIAILGIETAGTFDPTNGFYRSGIYAQNTENFHASRVTVAAKSTGIHVEDGNRFTVLDCDLTGFWTHTNSTSGINNGAGVVWRDADGEASMNRISGFGQGVCSLNRLDTPAVLLIGNRIWECADNGVYLVVAQNSTVSGNLVTNVAGSGIKVHGSGHTVIGNTIHSPGLGISLFAIHSVPTNGSREYNLSTNKWGPSTTNWFTGLNNIVSGNTISFSGRHGIDAGYTTIAPNYYWQYGALITDNNIFDFGSSATDIGIRVSGDYMTVEDNHIIGTLGTSATYGILFGGQTADLLGWLNPTISDNVIVFSQNYPTGIQITDAANVQIAHNQIVMPLSVLGMSLGGLSNVKLADNWMPYSQLRLALSASTNLSGHDNTWTAVTQVVPPVGMFFTYTDTNQLTADAVRSSLASVAATYPYNLTTETNAQRGMISWNKSDGNASIGIFQAAAGNAGSASVNLLAYADGYTGALAGMGGVSINSDTAALFLAAPLDSQSTRIYNTGVEYLRVSTNGVAIVALTNNPVEIATFSTSGTGLRVLGSASTNVIKAALGLTFADIGGTISTNQIPNGSLATNKIDSTFYSWVESMGVVATNLPNLTVTNPAVFQSGFRSYATNGVGLVAESLANLFYVATNLTVLGDVALGGSSANTLIISAEAYANEGVKQGFFDPLWLTSVGFNAAAPVRVVNFADSPEAAWAVSAVTNRTLSLVAGSISTNKIDSTFYTLLTSGGGGSSNLQPPSTNGLLVYAGTTNLAARHIVGSTQIGVSNGDGQSGNVLLSVNSASVSTNLIDSTFRSWVESMASGGVTNAMWTGATNAIPASEGTNIWTHTLGAVPKILHVWLLCTDTDTDYVAGDIIPITATFQWTTADLVEVPSPLWGLTADASAVYLSRRAAPGSGGIRTFAKADGRQVSLDETKWVVYATASLGNSGSSGGGSVTNLTTMARFIAQDGEPPSSSYATFGTRNSIGVMLFDPTTQEAMRYRFVYPQGYTATNATVVIKWTTSATSGDARWGGRFMALTGDIDSDSFATAVEATTTTSGTAGTVMTTTLSAVGLDGAVAGDQVWLEIYRDVSDAADTINNYDLELHSVEVRAE